MARRAAKSNEPVSVIIDDAAKPGDGTAGETGASGHGDDGDGAGLIITVDPATVGTGGDAGNGDGGTGEPGRRKRGRKPGSRNAPKAAPLHIDAIEALLYSVHASLAFATGTPELALEKQEAGDVAKAYANVARHYPVMQQSEKFLDWTGLLSVLGMVYGTRFMAMRARVRNAPRAQSAPPAAPAPQATASARAEAARGDNVVSIAGVGPVVIPPGAI